MTGSSWIKSLFWRLQLSPRALRIWGLVLLLAPLAWVGGLTLRYQIARATWPQTMLDRAEALRKASDEARQLGFETSGWTQSFELHADERIDQTIKEQKPPMRRWLYNNMPPQAFLAGFRDPKSKGKVELDLNPRGNVTGFRAELAARSGCAEDPLKDRAAAQAIFRRRFAQWPNVLTQDPDVSHVQSDRAAPRTRFAWQVTVSELPDLEMRLEVETACGQTVADHLAPSNKAPKRGKGWKVTKDRNDESPLGGILISLYFCVAIPWIAIRYVKRTIQGEAPQGRILLAGAIFAVSTALTLYDKASGVHLGDSDLPLPLLLVFVSVGVAMVAALFGMAYAAAEGEVRELYPGTLTSMDALLTGRWNTRNAGASILIGMALGGWLLLATQAAALLHARRPVDTGELEFAFAQVPWLSALMKAPFQAVLTSVFGLLVPLALFHRWTRRVPWLYRMLVFTATAVGFSATAPSNLLSMGYAIWGLACALCLFAAFYLAADLLAGLAALGALRLGLAAGVLAAASPGYADLAVLLGCALVTAALAIWAARSGRIVHDEEVRPRYASNLAERLRLEHEIDATRVAQQRLLPLALPQLPGLSAAAECLPAREVAGDFYDAYSIGGGRLAVLLAEGGGQRLARALSIALVKGYLMQKSASGRSPGELLSALHTAVGNLVEGSTGNLCYAVIDPLARTLRYARTGEWPAVLLRRTPDSPTTPCAESTRWAGTLAIHEGAATLEPGSLLLLYTDGVAQRGALVRRLRRDRFEQKGALLSATQVVATMMERVSKRTRRRLSDDLTLVAVRVNEVNAAVREGVA